MGNALTNCKCVRKCLIIKNQTKMRSYQTNLRLISKITKILSNRNAMTPKPSIRTNSTYSIILCTWYIAESRWYLPTLNGKEWRFMRIRYNKLGTNLIWDSLFKKWPSTIGPSIPCLMTTSLNCCTCNRNLILTKFGNRETYGKWEKP